MSKLSARVCERIRIERQRRGWSQAALAEKVGVTQGALSFWESGKRSPGLDDLDALADAFGMQPVELLGGDEEVKAAGITADLLQVRATLDQILRRVTADGQSDLPAPSGRTKVGIVGPTWTADRGYWTVVCPEDADVRSGNIYVRTPHSTHGTTGSDMVAVPYAGASELAAVLLGATERARYEDHCAARGLARTTELPRAGGRADGLGDAGV